MESISTGWAITFAIILASMMIRSLIVVGAAFAWYNASSFAQRRRVYRLAYAEGQIGSELQAAVTVIAFDALVFSTVRHFGLIQYAQEPSALLFAGSFLLVFLFTEIWFYVTHRAMHHKALFWIHRQHHTAKVTDPLTSLSFSIIERAILIGGILALSAMVSLAIPLSMGGLIAVGLSNYVLNVLGHSNVEFMPVWFAKSRIGRFFITPSYHAMHHARFRGHYGLFTTVLDSWFATRFEDYEQVYDRAREGRGLDRLGERVESTRRVSRRAVAGAQS